MVQTNESDNRTTNLDLDHFLTWLLSHLAQMDIGCLTGDCDHMGLEECLSFIKEYYYQDTNTN